MYTSGYHLGEALLESRFSNYHSQPNIRRVMKGEWTADNVLDSFHLLLKNQQPHLI